MAAPEIVSVEAPAEVPEGSTFEVKIVARDPDARVVKLAGIVSDEAGNTANVTVEIPVTDPLTYTLEAVEGAPQAIVQSAPGVFQVTV